MAHAIGPEEKPLYLVGAKLNKMTFLSFNKN